MDLFKQQLIDSNRAKVILNNTHDRMSRLRRRTDEDYLRILVDEINKYFATLETTSINSNSLPNRRRGPSSIKHNELLNNSLFDIDLIRTRHRGAEDMLTRAVNFMSSEREGVAKSISKLHSRMLGHKLRSSVNDRGLTVYTEYFNDEGLTDLMASRNFKIDTSRSALSLGIVTQDKDKGNLIDPSGIRITVQFDADQTYANDAPKGVSSTYPLCNQIGADEYTMAYGKSLSNVDPFGEGSKEPNIINATADDKNLSLSLQRNVLKTDKIIGDLTPDEASEISYTEFELVWSDFKENPNSSNFSTTSDEDLFVIEPIIESIVDAGFESSNIQVDATKVLFDADGGTSFRGANKHDNGEEIQDKITRFYLKFSIRDGSTFQGILSRVNLLFLQPTVGGVVPTIDYANSSITTAGGDTIKPFINPPDSIENSIQTARALMLNTLVDRPKHFKLALTIPGDGSASWEMVNKYKGALWRIPTVGSQTYGDVTVTATSGTLVKIGNVSSSVSRVYFLYHDIVRTEEPISFDEENIKVAARVLDSNKMEIEQ